MTQPTHRPDDSDDRARDPDEPDQTDVPPDDDLDRTVPTKRGSREGRSHASGDRGEMIGGYCILERLGGGGMGDVFLAEDPTVKDRRVAVKTIRPEYAKDRDFVRRLEDEAASAGNLRSPYVITIHQKGFCERTGLHYLVMEWANGGALKKYATQFEGNRLPPDEGRRLLRQAARGLLAAERHKTRDGTPSPIYHRDIKPENLLLSEENGHVDLCIADFGIAKRETGSVGLTGTGTAPMTPAYAAYEQWEFDRVDHRTDMYSLGRTFYELLTGVTRACEETTQRGLKKFVTETPCLSPAKLVKGFPADLDQVIRRMTMRDRDKRYRSFQDVVDALEEKPEPVVPKWLVAVAGLVVLAAMGFVASEAAGWTDIIPEPKVDVGPVRVEREELEGARAAAADLLRKSAGDAAVAGARERLVAALAPVGARVEWLDDRISELEATDENLSEERYSELRKENDELTAKLGEAAQVLDEAVRCVAALDRLEASASKEAFQAVKNETDRIGRRYRDALALCEELGERLQSLRTHAEQAFASSEERVDDLESRFRDAPDDLGALRGDIETLRQKLDAVGEEGLVDDLDALDERAELAAEVESKIPSWPPADAEPIHALEQLPRTVKQLDALVAAPGGDDFGEWWRNRRWRQGRTWFPDVRRFYEQHRQSVSLAVERVEKAILAKEPISRREHRAVADARKRLMDVRNELYSCSTLFAGNTKDRFTELLEGELPPLPPMPEPGDSPPDLARIRDDLRELGETIAHELSEERSKHEALGPHGELTEGAFKGLEEVRRRVDASVEAVEREIALHGENHVGAPEDVDPLPVLKRDWNEAVRVYSRANACAAVVLELEEDIPDLSEKAARARLEGVEKDSALSYCPALKELTEELGGRIDGMAVARDEALAELRRRFMSAHSGVGLEELREDADALRSRMAALEEERREKSTRALLGSITAAQRYVDDVSWEPEPERPVKSLRDLCEAVETLMRLTGEIEDAEDEDLVSWWQRRQRAIGEKWFSQAKALLDRVEPSTVSEVERPEAGVQLERLVKSIRSCGAFSVSQAVTLTEALSDARRRLENRGSAPSPPPLPDHWPPEAKDAWNAMRGEHAPRGFQVPEGLRYDDRHGWYLAFRTLPKNKHGWTHVRMVLVHRDGVACLVDRFELTLQELVKRHRDGRAGAIRYLSERESHIQRTLRQATEGELTLACWLSLDHAKNIAERGYQAEFSLPDADLWDILTAGVDDFRLTAVGRKPASVDDILALGDESPDGVLGLRSGVREWSDGRARGQASFEHPFNGSFNIGCRLVLKLESNP